MIFYLLKYYIETKIFSFLPFKWIQKVHVKRVRNLFEWSKEHSEFYRKIYSEAGVLGLKVKTLEDIGKIPIVDKEQMRAYGFDKVLTTEKSENLVFCTTSGTNGLPIQVFSSKKEHFTSYVRTFLALHSFNPFQKFGVVGVVDQKKKIEKKTFLYFCQRYLKMFRRESFSISSPPSELVSELEKRKINYFSSMPSCFKVLVEELKQSGKKLPIKYIITAGETLDDTLREDIKTYFQAKIINVYGCMELPSLAWTKPDKDIYSYPLNSVFIEYINCVEISGELYGELVITNLLNKTMPFVRYKITDYVKITDSIKYMGTIMGRSDDVIKLENGQNIYMMQLYRFSRIKGLYQYKFLQKKNNKICFQAVCKSGANKPLLTDKILDTWRKYFGNHPLEVQFVAELPLNAKTGKFKKMEIEN